MKIRANRSRNVVLEMKPEDQALPPASLPELQLRHILAPVDFSECSHKALRYAFSLAKQFNSELMLLHVVVSVPPPPQMMVFDTESLTAKYHEEAAKQLSEWRNELVSPKPIKAVVRAGISAHQEIVTAAHECNSDLIVIGNHGRTGLARILTGSTAERVVRYAPCPVFIVREREHDFLVGEQDSAVSKVPREKASRSHATAE